MGYLPKSGSGDRGAIAGVSGPSTGAPLPGFGKFNVQKRLDAEKGAEEKKAADERRKAADQRAQNRENRAAERHAAWQSRQQNKGTKGTKGAKGAKGTSKPAEQESPLAVTFSNKPEPETPAEKVLSGEQYLNAGFSHTPPEASTSVPGQPPAAVKFSTRETSGAQQSPKGQTPGAVIFQSAIPSEGESPRSGAPTVPSRGVSLSPQILFSAGNGDVKLSNDGQGFGIEDDQFAQEDAANSNSPEELHEMLLGLNEEQEQHTAAGQEVRESVTDARQTTESMDSAMKDHLFGEKGAATKEGGTASEEESINLPPWLK